MNIKKLVVIFFCCFLFTAVKSQKYADGIIAVIGDKYILRSDFEAEKLTLFQNLDFIKDSSKLDCYILQQLIIRKLLSNQAEIDSLPLEDARVYAEIDNRIRSFEKKAGSQRELEQYLGMSVEAYKEYIYPRMREQLMMGEMQNKVTGNSNITPTEVKIFFDSIPKDSLPTVPMEVEIAQMIIFPPISEFAKAKAKYKIESLREKIMKGESFDALAKIYSEDPGSGAQGGLLPEFGRGEMVPAFERMAFRSKIDSVTEIFESSFGYHIMKVISRSGEKVLARHILIKPQLDEKEIAKYSLTVDSVYRSLNSGEIDWCSAVKKNAHKEYGNRGNCGFIQDESTGHTKVMYDALSADIKKIVSTMKPGQYSQPEQVPTGDGGTMFIILYLKSQTLPHKLNYESDYPRILSQAENQKKQKMLEEWVEKARKKNNVVINYDFLNCPDISGWNNSN